MRKKEIEQHNLHHVTQTSSLSKISQIIEDEYKELIEQMSYEDRKSGYYLLALNDYRKLLLNIFKDQLKEDK